MLQVALSSGARMDYIITFKISFKILGTLTLQAFLNKFKNSFTTALLQCGPIQNVHCRVAAHSSYNYSGSPVLEDFKALFVNLSAAAPHTYTVFRGNRQSELILLALPLR